MHTLSLSSLSTGFPYLSLSLTKKPVDLIKTHKPGPFSPEIKHKYSPPNISIFNHERPLTASFVIPRGQSNRSADVEMGTQRSGELGLEIFFKQVQEIDKQYDKLNMLLQKLQDAHEESRAVTKAAAMKAIKQRMEKDVDEVGKIARFIKSKIEAVDRDNLANRQKPGCGNGTAVDRSRTATTLICTKASCCYPAI